MQADRRDFEKPLSQGAAVDVGYKRGHIFRKGSCKGKLPAAYGVDKVQTVGVERLAADPAAVGVVEKVSRQRMAYGGHMNPDLMGSSCFQAEADIGQIPFFIIGEPPEMGSGCFAFLPVDSAQNRRAGGASNGLVY